MPSYYRRVVENLKPNYTAKSEDIHLIQSKIQEMAHDIITDNFGNHYILGEGEEDLKLIPTTDYIDQSNYHYAEGDNKCWISFYDRYLRQSIYIEKSSIESIILHMKNLSKIDVTIYAEIRDSNFDIVKEASAILKPFNEEAKDPYSITFNFDKHHIPVGHYYFVLRPVDVSLTDLTISGDEYNDIILPEQFLVRYDFDGTYEHELQASYDGSNYLDAYLLEDQLLNEDAFSESNPENPNYDLYFEERYSSGNTFLINPGAAVVFGQRVDSYDTHIKIRDPSHRGDRVDLIILTSEGKLDVVHGPVGGEYPISNSGLKIAYITSYKNGEKPAKIEQDDTNNITRQRDVLERIRRLEKKTNYQMTNNSPSRIKYTEGTDPVMFNNGLANPEDLGEGTYGMGMTTNADGENVVRNENIVNLIWSIIKNTYTYTYEETKSVNAYCQVFDVDIPVKKPSNISTEMVYKAYVSNKEIVNTDKFKTIENPASNIPIQIVIKKGNAVKYSKTMHTSDNGVVTLSNLWSINLEAGTYNMYSIIGDVTIKRTLTVHNRGYKVNTAGQTTKKISLINAEMKTVTQSLSNNIITGDDSFIKKNVAVDIDEGIIKLDKIDTSKDEFTKTTILTSNEAKVSSTEGFDESTHSYKIDSNKVSLESEFPVMHINLARDAYVKTITPYISEFKNIEKFGIVLFKNDDVISMRNHKRRTIEKKMKNDTIYPNIIQEEKQISGYTSKEDGTQTINSPISFTVNKKLDAGTYTLIAYGTLQEGKKEGYLYVDEYNTHGNLEEYGLGAKCTGSSNLSLFKFKMNELTDRSWNVLIEKRDDKYQISGTITSPTKNIGNNINACGIKKNVKIPNGCNIKLLISNDGGASWVDATNTDKIVFSGRDNSFRWKMELYGNENDTPRLIFDKEKKYAIAFELNTETYYVPYEDYQKCYETPLMNANAITRSYLQDYNIQHRFSEWEMARVFMEDTTGNSKIDICISNDDDDYTLSRQKKENWGTGIFFKQILADLKLSDFNRDSVDYDNYAGSVEYDEHNFPLKIDTNAFATGNTGFIFASPIETDKTYGNINNEEGTNIIKELFTYENVNKETEYQYLYDGTEETERYIYSGAQIKSSPYMNAIFTGDSSADIGDYVINGVRFSKPLVLDDTKDILRLMIYPTCTENKTSFEPGTFSVVVSLSSDATLSTNTIKVWNSDTEKLEDVPDNSYGKKYVIDTTLEANTFNQVNIPLSEDIDIYSESGIRSIGIVVNKKEQLKKGDAIGLGVISGINYNPRHYVPLTYSGAWDRFKWQVICTNEMCNGGERPKIYNLCDLNDKDGKYKYTIPYPTSKCTNNEGEKESLTNADILGGIPVYHTVRTANTPQNGYNVTKIERNKNKVVATINDVQYSETTSGNDILFEMPANIKGNLFKINTDFPLSGYNMVNILYTVFCRKEECGKNSVQCDKEHLANNQVSYNNYRYTYDGYFSKGDILIKFYTSRNIEDNDPVEVFALPSWGRVQQRAYVGEKHDKRVNSWFKIRSDATRIKCIVIERKNPNISAETLNVNLKLVLNSIMFFKDTSLPALGPQMQMRIYPEDTDLSNIQIRKVGCIYRL